jgi:hypothetical protein
MSPFAACWRGNSRREEGLHLREADVDRSRQRLAEEPEAGAGAALEEPRDVDARRALDEELQELRRKLASQRRLGAGHVFETGGGIDPRHGDARPVPAGLVDEALEVRDRVGVLHAPRHREKYGAPWPAVRTSTRV